MFSTNKRFTGSAVEAEAIKAMLQQHIDGAEVTVQIDGTHVNLVVVSDRFEGLNTLKKQQLVYGALNAAIADGRIHAVHMKTYTTTEWQAQHS